MKFAPGLDLLLSALVVAFAIPAWMPVVSGKSSWPKVWKPVSLMTLSLLGELVFLSSITFGPFTLEYSLRFAVFGIPLSILAIVLVRRQNAGAEALGVIISSVLSLLMWLFLITLH